MTRCFQLRYASSEIEQDSVAAETEEGYEPAECLVLENLGVNPGF